MLIINNVYAQPKNKSIFTDLEQDIVVRELNQEFDIILPSNPITGYSWKLKKYDSKILAKIKDKFYPPMRTDPHSVGAPGYEKWTFKVIDKNFLLLCNLLL